MRKLRLAALLCSAAALLTNLGCVELDGQRLSWFYDAARDELKILLHYDGIHESRAGNTKGIEQIPKFVESGSILVWDWPFHIDMADVREKAADQTADPKEKELAAAMLSMKVEPVGYYREPDGRVGAAQMITIPNAKKFVALINEVINTQMVFENDSPSGPMARTEKRIVQAAKVGHRWITLDGHAVRVVIPVHPTEWALVRGEFLEEVAEGVARSLEEDANTDDRDGYRMILGLLASAPISYVDLKDEVEFVVGWSKTPCTFRAKIRDEYEPSLEKVLIESVKIDLDAKLAEALLDGDAAEPSPGVSAMLEFGPPEETVRALLAVAGGEDEGRKKTALGRLGKFARQWNRECGQPEAPGQCDDADDYLAAWRQWYEQMRVFPLKVEQSAETEPADLQETDPADQPAETEP